MDVDYFGALLASFQVQPLLIDWVRGAQCLKLQLMKIKGEVE